MVALITKAAGRRRWGKLGLGLLIVTAAGLTSIVFVRALRRDRLEQRGEMLFVGSEPLAGEIAEQGVSLPAHATRCLNCHGAAIESDGLELVAPRLQRAALLSHISRRHGPRVRYGPRSFCKLLRTGVDPGSTGVSRAMPRYRVTDPQCRALFAYLTRE